MVGTAAHNVEAEEASEAKQRIFETATRLFARQGFAATGVRELAREAGVSLATINYFYGSKVGLLKAILEDFFSGLLAILEGNLVGDGAPEDKLRRTVKAVAAYFSVQRDKMIVALTELPHDTPEITEFKAGFAARAIFLLHSQVVEPLGEAAGRSLPMAVIGPALPSLVASHFLFRPIIEKVRPPGFEEFSLDDYPDIIAELFLNGLNGLIKAQADGAGDG